MSLSAGKKVKKYEGRFVTPNPYRHSTLAARHARGRHTPGSYGLRCAGRRRSKCVLLRSFALSNSGHERGPCRCPHPILFAARGVVHYWPPVPILDRGPTITNLPNALDQRGASVASRDSRCSTGPRMSLQSTAHLGHGARMLTAALLFAPPTTSACPNGWTPSPTNSTQGVAGIAGSR